MKKLKKLAAIAIALVLLAIMLVATPVYAETVMVGNDPIKTEYSNYPLSNAIALIDEVFTKAGTVLSWEVYTRTPGVLGLLLLRPQSDGTYEIIGSDLENAKEGLNEFTFEPDFGGSAKVKAGDILGLYEDKTDVYTTYDTNDKIRYLYPELYASGETLSASNYSFVEQYSVAAYYDVTVRKDLGPLTDLEGTWYGQGWNVIAIPIKRESGTETNCEIQDNGKEKESFCIHAEPYCEILDISKYIEVNNKLFPENIVVPGFAYDQKVFTSKSWKPGDTPPKCPRIFSSDLDFKQIHGEKGNWLFLETEGNTKKLARIFSLGRGVMALAMGKGESKDLQAIDPTGGFPVAELGTDRDRYNGPYTILNSHGEEEVTISEKVVTIDEKKLGDFFNLENPNEVLNNEVIKGKATILEVSTDNSGGAIASIPFFNTPNDLEGAFQIPRFKSVFWIENIKDKNNLQLQYSQTTDLDFRKDDSGNLVLWPHVDVSTLCKDDYCK